MTAAEPLTEVREVCVVFEGGVRAVDGVSLDIWPGETLGLVGESGSGKTTLGKAMLGLYRPVSGEVLFAGRNVHGLGGADGMWFRREAQMILQDPVSSLSPRLTIRRLLAEPIRIHGFDMAEHWPRMRELMASIGLPEVLLDKYPHQISGGQARRVGMARALILNPRLIVADEPTAGLDVSIQGDLLNLMRDLQERFGLTYLIVSHNLNVIGKVTDRVAIMYLGKLVEIGPTHRIFSSPAHPDTHALNSANPIVDPHKRHAKVVLAGEIPSPSNPPPGCRFHTRCPQVQPRCRREEPRLAPIGDGRSVACHFPLSDTPAAAEGQRRNRHKAPSGRV